jgi:hypothetical protein
MPNWCYNTATLHHDDKARIDAFEAELSKEDSQPLNHLRPNPAGEWDYGWSVDNWGTKWDVSIHDWEREDDNTIVLHFDSAWSPPTTIYEFLETEGAILEFLPVNSSYFNPIETVWSWVKSKWRNRLLQLQDLNESHKDWMQTELLSICKNCPE